MVIPDPHRNLSHTDVCTIELAQENMTVLARIYIVNFKCLILLPVIRPLVFLLLPDKPIAPCLGLPCFYYDLQKEEYGTPQLDIEFNI